MATLDVYMNGYLVGYFSKSTTGAHRFSYDSGWLTLPQSRPISLSMPLRRQPYNGDEVYNFFDNLLPDNPEIRARVVARYGSASTQPFDLLTSIGRDSTGALQLLPQGSMPYNVRQIEYRPLTEPDVEKILNGYRSGAPLGMLKEEQDFRISLAGAQEKTALLHYQDGWCLPLHATPTTDILKLPIGRIQGHSYTIDLSESVENELLCTLIAREFGLPVPDCRSIRAGQVKALAVKRFDRQFAADGSWIMRLPQEDFCQVLNVPAAGKYESHGGPGIKAIMDYLLGSMHSTEDRYRFMQIQVLFWLLAATDGHAKNFSLFIRPGGAFCLTPFYDILSLYPAMGGSGLNRRDAKLAMGLNGSRGKKYEIEQIFPRHFFQTAKAVGFSSESMARILRDFAQQADPVIARVRAQLPATFPAHIRDSILDGLHQKAQRLLVGW